MTEDSALHIASDEELLSRYALGSASATERERVDRHTSACPACREALRGEMLIAAGTRKLGRAGLKARLASAAGSPVRHARWPRVLSAAAVIGIVTGLGVYYGWFSQPPGVPPSRLETPPIAEREEPPKKSAEGAPGEEMKGKQVTGLSGGSASRTDAGAAAKQKTAASLPAPSAAVKKLAELQDRPTVSQRAAENELDKIQEKKAVDEFWSDGIVEAEAGARDASHLERAAEAMTNAARAPAAGASEISKDLKGNLKSDLAKEEAAGGATQFRLRQKPSAALPLDQESYRKGGKQQRIPTQVDQRGSTTTMTMYLDTLVDENELSRARVEALRGDSVIVKLGGKRILYRFPQGQAGQQQQK